MTGLAIVKACDVDAWLPLIDVAELNPVGRKNKIDTKVAGQAVGDKGIAPRQSQCSEIDVAVV